MSAKSEKLHVYHQEESLAYVDRIFVPQLPSTHASDIHGPPVDASRVLLDLNGLSCAMCAQAKTSPAYAM